MTARDLLDKWEEAVNQVLIHMRRDEELSTEALDQAAGVQVKSGLQAGARKTTGDRNCHYPG